MKVMVMIVMVVPVMLAEEMGDDSGDDAWHSVVGDVKLMRLMVLSTVARSMLFLGVSENKIPEK